MKIYCWNFKTHWNKIVSSQKIIRTWTPIETSYFTYLLTKFKKNDKRNTWLIQWGYLFIRGMILIMPILIDRPKVRKRFSFQKANWVATLFSQIRFSFTNDNTTLGKGHNILKHKPHLCSIYLISNKKSIWSLTNTYKTISVNLLQNI